MVEVQIKTMRGRLTEIISVLLTGALAVTVSASSWFFNDDFVSLQTAHNTSFGWEYLRRDLFGHILPGHRTLSWIITQRTPPSWWSVVLMATVFIALSGWGVRKFLVVEGVPPFIATVAGCAVVLSGSWLHTSQWYTALGYQFPGAMCAVLAACALQSWVRMGRYRHLFEWGVLIAIGLLFDERIMILGVMLVLLMLILGYRSLRRHALAGAMLVTVGITWLLLFALDRVVDGQYTAPSFAAGARYVMTAVFGNIPPTLFGWMVEANPFGLQPLVFSSASCLLLGLGLYFSTTTRRRRALVVCWWIVLGAAAMVPVAIWRAGSPYLRSSPYNLRYTVDILPFVVIAIVLVSHEIRRTKVSLSVMAVACAFFLAGVVSTTSNLVSNPRGDVAEKYVKNLSASSGNDPLYFDGWTPVDIVAPFFPSFNMLSGFIPVFQGKAHFVTSEIEGLGVLPSGEAERVRLNFDAPGPAVPVLASDVDRCRSGSSDSFSVEMAATSISGPFLNQLVISGEFTAGQRLEIWGWNDGVRVAAVKDDVVEATATSTSRMVVALLHDIDRLEFRAVQPSGACPTSVVVGSLEKVGP